MGRQIGIDKRRRTGRLWPREDLRSPPIAKWYGKTWVFWTRGPASARHRNVRPTRVAGRQTAACIVQQPKVSVRRCCGKTHTTFPEAIFFWKSASDSSHAEFFDDARQRAYTAGQPSSPTICFYNVLSRVHRSPGTLAVQASSSCIRPH